MKERFLTLALALGALALFYALMVPKPPPEYEKPTQPLTTEQGPNGYRALHDWLVAENISVAVLRERYDRLAQWAPGRGNLLITTAPHRVVARRAEIDALYRWIEQGNTMLVMASLADTPDWAMDGDHNSDLIDRLADLTAIRFKSLDQEDAADDAPDAGDEEATRASKPTAKERFAKAIDKIIEPDERELTPVGAHPLLAGVESVLALSEFPADDWRAESEDGSAVLTLSRRKETAAAALWVVRRNEGQIVVSGFGSSFTNKLLGRNDNAALLANIVAWSRAKNSNGRVVIDDAHQGAIALYDPDAFFADARLHRALWWLFALWLVFVLGPSRLRAAAVAWNPVDVTAFVRATGGFLARTLRPAEAGRQAMALFFNSVRRRVGLPEDGAPVWEWLAGQSKVAPADLSELRMFRERIDAGRKIDLAKLHNLLHRITGSFV